jgi:hypothetical protein
MQALNTLTSQPKALWALLRSFRKRTWTLADYPIRILYRPGKSPPLPERLIYSPWTAQVINWWVMRGDGVSREDALRELHRRFAEHKDRSPLPRPGLRYRPKIEFASSARVEQLRPFVDDLVERVLRLNPRECFISDESSLWDFHAEETNDELLRRISLLYGIDASHLEPPTLAAIAQLIATNRGRA